MSLLPLLPMVLVLLYGTGLWVWLLCRPSRIGELGLGDGSEPPPVPAALPLAIVVAYLPLKIVVLGALGIDRDSDMILVLQASVLGNLLTVVLFAVGLVLLRDTSGTLLCESCGWIGRGLRCHRCGAPLPAGMSASRLEPYGLAWRPLESLRVGVLGLLLAYPPVILTLLASAPLRTVDKIHPFLQALMAERNDSLVAWVFLSAAVAAPLAEELVFRVCLQGWLRTVLRPGAAIPLVAVAFAAIHGWPDMLGLLPLALLLGLIYEWTHDYWAVVLTHGFFNALMTWNTLHIDPEEYEKALDAARNAVEEATLLWGG